ncbi:MAG: hypothetical protein HZB26_24995 [Candidatus Hydrogenedentes bacterium]|nr:hypothetical protein [Candidatus Hydrogenedentota bacterium]
MTTGEHHPTLTDLEVLRQQRQEVLGHVLDLLEKAEDRNADEPENETKWRRVLNNLWKSFDEAKARLAEVEAMIEQEHRKTIQPAPSPLEPQAAPAPAISRPASQEPPAKAPAATPRYASLKVSSGKSVQERRLQLLYRGAIDKVKDRRIAWMTMEELDLAIEFFGALSRRHNANPEDDTLTRFLDKASINVDEVCAEMRRRRAQLYAKKTR